MTTWDDLPNRFVDHVGAYQREVVNELLGKGYRMEMVWPDLNYADLDRMIFLMEKEMAPGRIAQAFADADGRVNDASLNEYLEGNEYLWRKPQPEPTRYHYPGAPREYVPIGAELEFLRDSEHPDSALMCVRYAAAINSGPPRWITGHLARGVLLDSQSAFTLHGRHAVSCELDRQINWKRQVKTRNRMAAELGWEPDSGTPCAVTQFSLFENGVLKAPECRNYTTFQLNAAGQVAEIIQISKVPDPSTCRLSGIQPGVVDSTGRQLPSRRKPRL